MRKTNRELARLFNAEKVITPATVAVLNMVSVGTDKALKFVATITIGATTYEVCSDNGKIKTFSDVDGFLKFAAKAAEKGDGVYTVVVDTGPLLASRVPSNLQTDAASKIVTLNRVKVGQNAVIAELGDQLTLMAGWESGNAAQQAKKIETKAQKTAVETDVAAIGTELARLAPIAAG